MVDVDVLPLDQLADEAAAQRGTDRPVQAGAVFFFDVLFDLFRDRNHVGENGIAAVKAVVVDADQVIFLAQAIQHSAEVRLIVAGRPRQQHQGLSGRIAQFNKLHGYTLLISGSGP